MHIRYALLPAALLALAGCGGEAEEPVDTSFERGAPAPVPTDIPPGEPVADNEVGSPGDDVVIDGMGGEAPEAERPTADLTDYPDD